MYWLNLAFSSSCSKFSSCVPAQLEHVPVLCSETIEHLNCKPGKNYLDLTLGGGGHAQAILEATSPTGFLVGIDRDEQALHRTQNKLQRFSTRLRCHHLNLGNAEAISSILKNNPLHGAMIDCGISTFQLGDSERGFSFLKKGPLDMRMDFSKGFSASDWLSGVSQEELANTIFHYGEDRYSRRIAKAIILARKKSKITDTVTLAEIIYKAVPGYSRSTSKIHPATRTFQAIRIVVNDELGELERGIHILCKGMPLNARIVVITFHSLEDRIVKNLFRTFEKQGLCKIMTKKPICPSWSEIKINSRSRSAKLRCVEIIRES